MASPHDQQLRRQRFTQAHPEWSIHSQDGARRFTAEKNGDRNAHIVAAPSLRALLDRLDEIEDGQ